MVILILQIMPMNMQISSQQNNGTPEFWEIKLPRIIKFNINHESIFLRKV